jgi:hypothetical protein
MDTHALTKLANEFKFFVDFAVKLAAIKKSKKKSSAVFPANSKSVKDKKEHFPITNINQARNALARCKQYSKAPPWYRGSLSSLQEAVRRAVHKKYPSIEISDKKKSS